ncbi:hypothetical protein, partial [Pseudomonas syringae group genomosp. 7]|uniref:hypothetical protein n=1 Tax=Pseudomonas syringae group genomosp. 7 TaxID=251699 RepID=UPI003770021E
ARQFIFERFYKAVALIRSNPEMLSRYREQLKGVKINDLISDYLKMESVFLSVDVLLLTEHNRSIQVVGWTFDALSSTKPEISVFYSGCAYIHILIGYVYRCDVLELYPDADS